jgi:hypothetical protein
MKIFMRKGQAALEFMMTYGWAILVVLAAIGALSYFGILNPSKFTPDTCLASSGFACPGKPIVGGGNVAGDGTVIFSIVNGLGYKVTIDTADMTLMSGLSTCGPAGGNGGLINVCPQGTTGCAATTADIQDGAGVTFNLSGCDFTTLNVVKGEMRQLYKNPQSMLDETLIVSITGKGKSG